MKLCGINITCNHLSDLLKHSNKFKQVVTINAEAIARAQKDKKLYDIINNSTTTIDGQIPLWLYKYKFKTKNIEKISGSDLIYDICKWAKINNYKIFLLGGNPDSNQSSQEILKKTYQINITGYSPQYSPYPFSQTLNQEIFAFIQKFQPEILFVAFGMGKQEYWINDNIQKLEECGVKMAIGCGGTFEFVSGKIKRAPKLMQTIGLEGLWRLIMEPKMFRVKRILTSMKIFYYFFKS